MKKTKKNRRNLIELLDWVKRNKIFLIVVAGAIIIIVVFFVINSPERKRQAEAKQMAYRLEKIKDDCSKSIGVFWCDTKQKCLKSDSGFCGDEVNKLVQDIKNNTGVALSDDGESNFTWNTNSGNRNDGEKNLTGEIFEANNLKLDDVKKVQDYLNTVAKIDKANEVDGPAGGLRGYSYNNLVCTLDFRYKEMKSSDDGTVIPASDNLSVKFKGGFLK